MTARIRRSHLSMDDGPRPRRQHVADQDRDTAEAEMWGVGEEPRRERQVEEAVDQNTEVEIAAAGEETEDAIGKVEHAEQLKEQFGGAARSHCRSRCPERRNQMQAVSVPGAAEQAEDHVIGVDEGGYVSGQDDKAEQGGVAPGAQ